MKLFKKLSLDIKDPKKKGGENPKKEGGFFRRKTGSAPLWLRMFSISLIWTIFVLLLAGFLLSLTFRSAMEDNFNGRLVSLMDNLIRIGTSDLQNIGDLSEAMTDPRFETAYSGWYWQISTKGLIQPVRSVSLWDEALSPDFNISAKKIRFSEVLGPENQLLKMVERDVHIAENDITFRFSVAIDQSEIRQQVDEFDRILLIYLSILGAGLLLFSGLQVIFTLRPLGKIKSFLTKIRNGTESHMPSDLPSEIRPLADELNALIDHNRQIVERSRTQVGNLAHALKTPLTIMMNEAALDKKNRSEKLSDQVEVQTGVMHRQIDYYLRRARMAASLNVISSHCKIRPVLSDLIRAMRLVARDKKFIFNAESADNLIFKGERQDLEEMIGNLLENAAKWTKEEITLSCFLKKEMIHILIIDDGSGIDLSLQKSVFSRGERLDENTPGTGLGLSIVKDLTHLYGGKINLYDSNKSPNNKGLTAEIILPSLPV